MRIQAISTANNYQTNSKAPTFKALWMRFGQKDLLDATKYHSAVMFPLKYGKQLPVQKFYKGSPVLVFKPKSENELTVEESKNAISFLFGKIQNEAGYIAAQKLRGFVESITTKDMKHNILFLEKEDFADPANKAKVELKLADITSKIDNYEKKHKLVKETPKVIEAVQDHDITAKELMKFLTENGVA